MENENRGPYLIAVDLDDTTLQDLRTLNARSAGALRAAQDRGHRVMIATARPSCIARGHYEAMGLETPIALLNGAEFLHYTDRAFPHERHYLTADTVARVMGCFPAGAVAALWLENNDELYATGILRGSPYFDEVYDCSRVLPLAAGELPALDVGRLFFWLREEAARPEAVRAAEAVPGVCLTHRPWREGRGLVLFSARSSLADKWFCVEQAANYYGIPPQNIVAFGDEENDVMMLQRAGRGYCMRNAREPVRAKVRLTTERTCYEGGVAHTLEALLGATGG